MLVVFVQERTRKPASALDWQDLPAETIGAFLDHLEAQRGNSARTRNLRLTAIRSLFAYAALRHPEHAALIQQVLAIPAKRYDKAIVSFLTTEETDALIAAPDLARWEGRRDRALLLLAVQTGLRVSELTGLNCGDLTLGTGACVRCQGKGRKHRAVPLLGATEAVLKKYQRLRARKKARAAWERATAQAPRFFAHWEWVTQASGAVPVLRPWPGAVEIYDLDWIHPSVKEAAATVLANADPERWQAQSARARKEIRRTNDPARVAAAWADLLHGDLDSARSPFDQL